MFDHTPDMAKKRAELAPHKIAFETDERTWTFKEINAAADALATGLLNTGLNAGDKLAMLSLNRVEFFISLFACQKSGLILAPLNWRQPQTELIEVLSSVGATAIIFDQENADVGRAIAENMSLHAIALDDSSTSDISYEELLQSDPIVHSKTDSSAPWYLLFTSGTTGLPKAVIYTAQMAWANTMNISHAMGLSEQDRSANFLPLFHTGGINLYTLSLFLLGGTSIILPRFDPNVIFELIQKGKINQLFAVPAIFQAFSLHKDVDDVDWTTVGMGCGGAPLPEPLIRFFADRGAMICNGFGMTETGASGFLMDRATAKEKIGSVGRPMLLMDIRLAGVEENQLGEGEIQLRGPSITPGYFENLEATQSLFTEDGWMCSGDVGRRDEDGYYFIVDRIKDMYISGGENVYPAEIERILAQHPDILEAAVIGIPDEKWGEVGAAYLLPRPDATVDISTLSAWCRERMAPYKIPKHFDVISEFPRTAAGKIRKTELRKQ